MARYDCELTGEAEALVAHLDQEIFRSMSASLEEQVEHRLGDGRMRAMSFKMDTVSEGTFIGKATAALQSFGQA